MAALKNCAVLDSARSFTIARARLVKLKEELKFNLSFSPLDIPIFKLKLTFSDVTPLGSLFSQISECLGCR